MRAEGGGVGWSLRGVGHRKVYQLTFVQAHAFIFARRGGGVILLSSILFK